MFGRCSIRVVMIMAAVLTLSVNTLNAAWWEGKDVPVPWGAEEAYQETRRIAGSNFVFTYYRTTQDSVDTIKAFYRSRLANSGWKKREILNELRQVPNVPLDISFGNALEQNLMFEKDTDVLIINFMPEGAFNDGKTRFSVAKGKIDFKNVPIDKEQLVPALIAKPKKEVAPVYPGASLISLSETDNSSLQGYYTQDDIETAIIFYKENMPNKGWALVGEKPVQETFAASGNLDLAKHCPNCTQFSGLGSSSIKNKVAELHFSNASKDTCDIVFSNQSSELMKAIPFSSMTVVMVNYEEEKKQ